MDNYCKYCMTKDGNSFGEEDLLKYDIFPGTQTHLTVSIVSNAIELAVLGTDEYTTLEKASVNFCPVCGRKLEEDEDDV